MPIQDEIRTLVANAKLEQAIQAFQNWANTNNKDLSNQLILLQGRFNSLKRNENLGLLSFSDANRERNILTNSVLSLLEEIDASKVPTSSIPSVSNPSSGSTNPQQPDNKPKTILFLASNPTSTAKLQLEKEYSLIGNSLQDNTKYKLYSKWATLARDVQNEIIDREPYLLHFSGHGTGQKLQEGTRAVGRPSQKESGLIFQDLKGNSKIIETDDLKRMFQMFANNSMKVSVVVLNACYSAAQAEAILPYVDYVIGMTTAVGDEGAITFAEQFYKVLGKNKTIEFAFESAVLAVDIDGLPDGDTPKLYSNKI